jgi:hypothetical protein
MSADHVTGPLHTNDECARILGKIKHLRSPEIHATLATEKAIRLWREEARSYAIDLASELLRLNPTLEPLS